MNSLLIRFPLCVRCARTLLLDEFYASGDSKEVSLSEWVVRESLPVVDHLTPRNFALYEKLGVPMLLLFLVREKSNYTSS